MENMPRETHLSASSAILPARPAVGVIKTVFCAPRIIMVIWEFVFLIVPLVLPCRMFRQGNAMFAPMGV